MTSEIFFKNFHFKNISTQKKPNPNSKINSKNKKNIKSSEKQRTKNQIITKKIKYNPKNIKFINYRNGDNVHNYYFGRNRNDPKIWTKQTKYKCIPISEFPKRNEDYTYDNLEYIKYIHNSIIVGPNMDPEKIKTVDANKYINNENNSISTFNELKLKLLNKNNKFNTPFVFYKNDIDFDDYKKVEDEKNYQIKRYRYLKAFKYSFNPVVRRKNSKIIQQWWRSKINPKIDKRKKLINNYKIENSMINKTLEEKRTFTLNNHILNNLNYPNNNIINNNVINFNNANTTTNTKSNKSKKKKENNDNKPIKHISEYKCLNINNKIKDRNKKAITIDIDQFEKIKQSQSKKRKNDRLTSKEDKKSLNKHKFNVKLMEIKKCY